jgi:hypothetical protein
MPEIQCPHCHSTNWDCWDQRTLTWWEKDGSMGATQVLGMLRCKDCGQDWADENPTAKDLRAAGLWVEDEDERWAYS